MTSPALLPTPTRSLSPMLKLALEAGPLVVFFLANQRLGIVNATAIFVAVTLLALVIHYVLARSLPLMPLVSGAMVLIFGGLTVFLDNDVFIKLKPTIVNSLFGIVLLGGLWFEKSFLQHVFGSVFALNAEGWRKLTFRWGLFFLLLAALNEIVWRTQSTEIWVNFKVFGIMPLTVVFALLQTPLLMRYEEKDAALKEG
jgi:intracellular septation protein